MPTNRIASVTNSGTTVNYSYDAAGNVTNDGVHSYTYDSENRIVSVDAGTTASYGYDQQNRRYKKTIGSTVTHYTWEGGQVLAEHNGSTGAVLVDYIYNGSRMIAKVAGGTTNYFLSDRLSARLMLDTSGNVAGRQAHLPYGEDFAESGTQDKHHFTTYERDSESGTDYATNRQYVTALGRFNRPDPFQGSMNFARPQTLNRYAYTNDDPVNNTDLLGLSCDPPCVADEEGHCDCPPNPPPYTQWGDGSGPGIEWIRPSTPTSSGYGGTAAAPCQKLTPVTPGGLFDKDMVEKTFRCKRPLKGLPGILGEHVYLCVMDKLRRTQCVSFGPSGSSGGSEGANIPEDVYDADKCKEVKKLGSNPLFAKCVYEAMNEPLPWYQWNNNGGTNCWKWTDDIIHGCKKKCKGS